MEITKGIIGNALTSAATDHIVAVANDIYDEELGKYQSELNKDIKNNIENNSNIKIFEVTADSDNTELFEYYANNPDGTYIKFKNLDLDLVSKIVQHNTSSNTLRGEAVFNQNNIIVIPTVYTNRLTINSNILINIQSIPSINTNRLTDKAVTTEKLSDEVNERIDRLKVFEVTSTTDNTELLNYCAENSDNLNNVIILFTNVDNRIYLLTINQYINNAVYTSPFILYNYLRYIKINPTNINTVQCQLSGNDITNNSIDASKLNIDIQNKLNDFKLFEIVQGKTFDYQPLFDYLDADVNNINKVVIRYNSNDVIILTTINRNNNHDIYTNPFIFNQTIKNIHIREDGTYYLVNAEVNGSYLTNQTVSKAKLANDALQPYTQYSYNDLDDLKEPGTYIISENLSGAIPVVLSVGLEGSSSAFVDQTIFDKTNGIFKRRYYNPTTNSWSVWGYISINGNYIQSKSISKTALKDDVLPKNTSDLVNDSGYVTSTEVSNAIQQIIDGAPEDLDTLREISERLQDDADAIGSIISGISTKVSKEEFNEVIENITNGVLDQIKIFDVNNTDNSELFTYITEKGLDNVYVRYIHNYDSKDWTYILKCTNLQGDRIVTERFIADDRIIRILRITTNSLLVITQELSINSVPTINTNKVNDKAITPAKLSDETLALIPDLVTFDVQPRGDNTELFDFIKADPNNYKKVVIRYNNENYNLVTTICDFNDITNTIECNYINYFGRFYSLDITEDNGRLIQVDLINNKSITSNKLEQSIQDQLNSFKVFRFIYNDVEHNKAEFTKCLEYYNDTSNTNNIILIFDDFNESTQTKYEDVVVTGFHLINRDYIQTNPVGRYNGATLSFFTLYVTDDGVYSKINNKLAGNTIAPNTIYNDLIMDNTIKEAKLADSLKEKLNTSEFFVIEVDEDITQVTNFTELQSVIEWTGPEGDRMYGITTACVVKLPSGRCVQLYPFHSNYSATFMYHGSTYVIDLHNGSIGQSYGISPFVTSSDIATNAINTTKIEDNAVTESKLSTEVQTKLNNTSVFYLKESEEPNAENAEIFIKIQECINNKNNPIVYIQLDSLNNTLLNLVYNNNEQIGFIFNFVYGSLIWFGTVLNKDGSLTINQLEVTGQLLMNNTIDASKLSNDAYREIDNRIVNKLSTVIGGAPESFDTLKEIADWIETHGDTALIMQNGITQNKDNITLLQNDIEDIRNNIATISEVEEILNTL